MRIQIIQAIKNTFGLTDNEDIAVLSTRSEVSLIKNLPALLALLANEKILPKLVAQALERVVVGIKLKAAQTAQEEEFLKQISELVDKPLYIVEQSAPKNNAHLP
ncbi:MAG: hypothetical protein EBY16_08520 [Gammaproteobacteria bacterium]|nr:hypothetical protein [Gammaproteobacteria bacterium]